MGAVVSRLPALVEATLPAIVSTVAGLISLFGRSHIVPNPILGAIDERNLIREREQDARWAEEQAAAVRASQAELQRQAEEDRRRAEDAHAARRQAEDDARRMREEVAWMEREESARRAREDNERRARLEEARRLQEEMALKTREHERNLETIKGHADSAKRAQMEAEKQREEARREAEEAKLKARAMREQAKKAAEAAEKRIQEERAARQKLEADLKNGVQPVELPTRKQVDDAKRKYQYQEGMFHFAIAGISGSGKSSLINALCGYPNNHPNAARTGIVETTSEVARFPDPDPHHPFAWYDVPGAGTLDIPDWQYFNNHGLYVFDSIIVLFDNRFTATDVAILKNCQRFNIPSYIVRSKSNQHIQNVISDLMEKLNNEDEDEDDAETVQKRRAELYPTARDTLIKQTRQNVTVNLHKAGLPHQKTYLISKDAMLSIVRRKVPRDFIDEYDLLKDILSDAKARRLVATETLSSANL